MHESNPYEFERHYRGMISRAKRRLVRMLDRFGESIYDWLTAALNWPEEDWQADLANFVAHSRMTGIEISEESLEQIRELVEARVNGTGVFAGHRPRGARPAAPTFQLAMVVSETESGNDATVELGEEPQEEVAGPGPETSGSFKRLVQRILQLLDPFVAGVWEDTGGNVRSRTRRGLEISFAYSTENDKDRPVIIVLNWFTARDVAMAILEAAYDPKANPISSKVVETKVLTDKEIDKRFKEIQTEAFKHAAAEAAYLAELYIGSIASLTPTGDLIVTIDDVSRNGVDFSHLLYALPMLAFLRKGIKRLILRLPGGKTLQLPGGLLEKLHAMAPESCKKLIAKAQKAKTKEDALDIIENGVAIAKKGPGHHIATDKNWISTLRGGPWSPRFEEIFERAGMNLKDAENIVRIPGHKGPHPEVYHREILRRLTVATKGKRLAEYKEALVNELKVIAEQAATKGTHLNQLLTQ